MKHRVAAVVLVFWAAACLSSTDARVRALSEVDCSTGAKVALVVASDPLGLAQAAPASVSASCAPASGSTPSAFDYGTVVISPESSKDEPIAFELLTRPDGQPPETCLDPTQTAHCIRASRQMRFAPHQETSVEVDLRLSCVGVVCPAGQTCVSGQCVDDHIPVGCLACGEGSLPASTAPNCGDMGGLQAGSPWPMPGYCPTRAGRSGRNGPTAPAIKWTVALGKEAAMSPAVAADGTVYVGSDAQQLVAVDPGGQVKWSAPVNGNINDTGVVIGADGSVYVGASTAHQDPTDFFAFTAAGALEWKASVGGDVAHRFVAGGDGTLYVNAAAPAPLFAVDHATGMPRWQLPPAGSTAPANFGVGEVAIGNGGTLYVPGADSRLHALRAGDGSTLWSAPTASVPSTPSVGDDGTIYVADSQALYALSPAGALNWSTPIDSAADGLTIGPDGTIYAACRSGTLYAVSPGGDVRWTFGDGSAWTLPGVAGGDGTLYIADSAGTLNALSPAGQSLWTVPTGKYAVSQPAIATDGTLYFVSFDGNLYAIGP